MTALAELVRISRWRLDEKRQKLTDLERLADRLHSDLERLDAGIAAEQKVAEADHEARHSYAAFLNAELERRKRLQRSIVDVQREIEGAREEVAGAFRELKKYELAKANHDAREQERRVKMEQRDMDEIGTQLYRRRKTERDSEGL